jgi:hypothetical protein
MVPSRNGLSRLTIPESVIGITEYYLYYAGGKIKT